MVKNQIVQSLFYKYDSKTNNLRISKTNVITVVSFILIFLWNYSLNYYYMENILELWYCIIRALQYAFIIFMIGWLIEYWNDKRNNAIEITNNKNRDFYLNNTKYHMQRKQYSDAINISREWVSIYPDDAEGWFLKSSIAADLNLKDEAYDSINMALKINPNDQRFIQLQEMLGKL